MGSNFDYIKFTENKLAEIKNLIPDDLILQQEYITDKLHDYLIKFGKNLSEYFHKKINTKKYTFACEEFSKWIFNKIVDLLRLKLSDEYIEVVIQGIAYVIYDIFMKNLGKNSNYKELSEKIELEVNKINMQKIKKLCDSEIFEEDIKNYILDNYNLDNIPDEKNNKFNFSYYSIKSDKEYLKDQLIISYAENLIYKYMLKAGRVLKKNDYKKNDRRIIITALKNALQMVVTRLEDFNKFELNFQIVERFITIATEIIFQRVITLHNLDILDKTSDMLDILACVIIDYETFYLRYAYDIRESFFWTNLYSNQDFKYSCKQYLDDGTITKKQYKNISKNSKIKFLKSTIKKIKMDKSMYPKGAHKRYWTFMIIYMIIVITFITICKYH